MNTYPNVIAARAALVSLGNALHILPVAGRKPVKFVANDAILASFDDNVFEQAVNTAEAPGVDQVIVGPDGHSGYGCPVGSVVVSRDHIYPGPVGPDISCSMSYLQTDLPDEAIADKTIRRQIINAICQRIPTGMGSRKAPKARRFKPIDLSSSAILGASTTWLMANLGIPESWIDRVENRFCHIDPERLNDRFESLDNRVKGKLIQIGSYGGGNHFGEAQTVTIAPGSEDIANHFGIYGGKIGFLSHCGSRGFGFQLAAHHFKGLESHFKRWSIPFPAGERELVYAPVDSLEGQAYLMDMCLGANFAIVNHLLINSYILEAFQEVIPGVKGNLVYHISHNIGQEEIVDNVKSWVFRKGATRAFPAGHYALKDTIYKDTGHPILLPGNPEAGSRIMVGLRGAVNTAYSINHGAGRAMGRNDAKRRLNQKAVDDGLAAADIMYNGRSYPIDEAPAAYKDFNQVCASIEEAQLAKTVATLQARFVIKDNDKDKEGAA